MSNRSVVVYLLRNDLRILDNEALNYAVQVGKYLLPIYCLDPRQLGKTHYFKLDRLSNIRMKFLVESLQDLRTKFQTLGNNLQIIKDTPENTLKQVVAELSAKGLAVSHLVFAEEAATEELHVEKELKTFCDSADIKVTSFWMSTLYHKDDLPFIVSKIPQTYTNFRQMVEARCKVRPPVQKLARLPPLPISVSGNISDLSAILPKDVIVDGNSAFPFKGGESSGCDRLRYYFWESKLVSKYKETRNGMIGPDYSTKFAPWLALGCLSPRFIYYQLKEYEKQHGANDSTYWVIFELLWRDYFRFISLMFGKKLFLKGGIKGQPKKWLNDESLFQKWTDGQTGVPYVDANMRELKLTGFMSNRGRQNVASFLVKDMNLDWRRGAEWFESQLIDYDVCSNYGNWQYSSGIGNDPRQDRKFNVVKQGLDYDPNGDYVRLWVPELRHIKDGRVHMPWIFPALCPDTYPKPVLIAPEWKQHAHRIKSNTGMGRGQRGIDFYFKRGKTS